jgi:hypothetical protein
MCSATPLTEKHHPPTWRASPPQSHPISGSPISAPGAFAVPLLRLDQKLADGIPMNPRRWRWCWFCGCRNRRRRDVGPTQPSPSTGQCLNAGYIFWEVQVLLPHMHSNM